MAADTAHTNDATAKALNMLKRIRKLESTALISGGVLLHDDCPRGTDTRLFTQSVVGLFDGLEKRGEYADDVLLAFDGGELLLMFRYPVILCLFFPKGTDVGSVEKGGNQFLNQFSSALGLQAERPRRSDVEMASVPAVAETAEPAPKVEAPAPQAAPEPVAEPQGADDQQAWNEFRGRVEILFTKVLGSAQASRHVSREMAAMGIKDDGNSYLKKAQFRPFGQKLTQRIRDKAIRRQIDDELVSIIESII